MNFLSIDVGGTYIKFGLVDHSGTFIDIWKEPTPKSIDIFKEIIRMQIQKHDNIKGIAMSSPGQVDSQKGYIHTGGTLMFLYDFAIKDWIKTITNLPFAVINDGKAAALGEWWIGNLKGVENGAAVVLGTGIGGGLILNNHLHQGSHYQAGELSFLIYPDQSENTTSKMYGSHGSAVRLIKDITKLLGTENDDYESVFLALEQANHPLVTKRFTRYCQDIASLLVNLQVMLDIEKVVIGGGISAQNLVITTIQEQYLYWRSSVPLLQQTFKLLEIEPCAFRNSSNLLGALYQLLLELEDNYC